jgi:wobble nucleotide-excising tRNase
MEVWREALKAKVTDPGKTDIQISDVVEDDAYVYDPV